MLATHPECRCSQCPPTQVPALDWLVTELVDLGASEYFRYRVEGVNLNHPSCHVDRRFSWRVPSVGGRYDLSAVAARPISDREILGCGLSADVVDGALHNYRDTSRPDHPRSSGAAPCAWRPPSA